MFQIFFSFDNFYKNFSKYSTNDGNKKYTFLLTNVLNIISAPPIKQINLTKFKWMFFFYSLQDAEVFQGNETFVYEFILDKFLNSPKLFEMKIILYFTETFCRPMNIQNVAYSNLSSIMHKEFPSFHIQSPQLDPSFVTPKFDKFVNLPVSHIYRPAFQVKFNKRMYENINKFFSLLDPSNTR